MTDPQTNDPAAQGTDAAGAANTGTDVGTQAAPPTLEKVVEDYEAALADFNAKLDQANAAKDLAKAAAQTVSDLKQQLDALEADVASTFDKVQAFLATA